MVGGSVNVPSRRRKSRSSFSACFDPFDQTALLSAAGASAERRRIKAPRRPLRASSSSRRRSRMHAGASNPSVSSSPPELAWQPAAQRGGGGGLHHNLPSFVTICCSLHTQRRSPVTPRSRHRSPPPHPPHPRRDLFLCHELFSDAPQVLKIAPPIVNYLISSDINIGVCCCCIMDAVFGVRDVR